MRHIYDIAIIGAGPAGIAAAVESVLSGITNIVLLEKAENHSETIRKFYKDNKRVDKNWKGIEVEIKGNVIFMDGTKESTLNYFDALIKHHKINSEFGCEVMKVTKEGKNFEIEGGNGKTFYASSVIVAIGNMGKPNKPSYAIPKSLNSIVAHNLEGCDEGEKILVVGGGDSAAEYAYYLADLNEVTLSYRREQFTRVNEQNLELVETYEKLGRLEVKLGVDIESLEDEGGKAKVNYVNGESIVYDRIVYALGGTMPVDFLKRCGIDVDEGGTPMVDENHEAKTACLYVAGDIIANSGGSIAVGLNHAHKIISQIKQRLRLS